MPPEVTRGAPRQVVTLPKVATHVDGLDAVLHGGLPAGRATLLWGGPGCGKSLLALEWLYRGAVAGDPGVLVLFEEGAAAVRQNALTLGWDLAPLEQAGKAGELLAARAKDAGAEGCVFDRGGYLFHGRVKALAEAAREAGLRF